MNFASNLVNLASKLSLIVLITKSYFALVCCAFHALGLQGYDV